MKRVSKSLLQLSLATLASATLAVSAGAVVSYGAPNSGQPYAGVKIGQVSVNHTNAPKAVISYGVYGGYNFDQNLGTELEFQSSTGTKHRFLNQEYEYKASSYGAYGTYRHTFNATPFYAKGKLGIARTQLQDKGVGHTANINSQTLGLAGGVGLGYAPNQNFGVEAGYSYLNGDSKALTVGAHLAF